MVPLATLVAMLGLMFVFVLAILGVVGDMHANGVWEKSCPTGEVVKQTSCPAVVESWNYRDESEWGGTCSSGSAQSPIDIITADAKGGAAADSFTDINTDTFKMTTAGEFTDRAFLVMKDNSIAIEGVWSYIRWGNKDWRFEDLKLHFNSEHKLDGKQFEVEVAIHFMSSDGKHLIMSFLGDRASVATVGESPRFIADVADLATSDMTRKTILFKFSDALVGLRSKCIERDGSTDCLSLRESAYYGYMGSLSVPPCTEGVQRLVMKEPFTIRDEDYDVLVKLTPSNSRPVKSLNDRIVAKVE
jgi:carbonic anhydrase